ncbi:PD-(D/E)XK nuclease domain-containing protein [Leptotrichia sp. oral taxon 223]|uniref:PD-(D/E)XK nuclease domain-containing protein n=1 Tax=Leptotrichia sp. oral taxon 223 TaxID=712363 RepID=UPI0021044878|nr:PD-(D/E)XK nuclease domain-containing protein [Leptotrichia sp. oral taxon 223]
MTFSNLESNYGKNISQNKVQEKLQEECTLALKQITEKEYISALKNAGVENILKIGVAFLGKEMEVKFER